MKTKEDVLRQFDIEGRVAIITGGSRGIGLSIAKGFAAAGAKVVISSRKAENCEAAAKEINDMGHQALSVPAHMGELPDLERIVDETVKHFGGVDIIVNNAANALAQPMGEITTEAWDKSFAVNLRGPVFLIQYALEHLKKSGNASIINVSSAGGYLFSGNVSMYAAAKAGLISFTRSFAAELNDKNIRVNCIAPGTIDTDMVRANTKDKQSAMAASSIMSRAAHPDEVVGLALYMASSASSFMTGATVTLDGGLVPR